MAGCRHARASWWSAPASPAPASPITSRGWGTRCWSLERASVASGTSWHAAGSGGPRPRDPRASPSSRRTASTCTGSCPAETGVDVNLTQCGSVTLARTAGRLDELRYMAAVCRHHGIPNEIICRRSGAGAVAPGDRATASSVPCTSRTTATSTRASPRWRWRRAPTSTGVRFCEGIRGVTASRTDGGRGRRPSRPTRARSSASVVVLAGGLWTRDLAAAVRRVRPAVARCPRARADGPDRRDRSDDPRAPRPRRLLLCPPPQRPPARRRLRARRASRSIRRRFRPDFAFGEFEPDWDHFAPVRALADRADPRAAQRRRSNASSTLPRASRPTPTSASVRPPRWRGLFVAAGFNSQGIIYVAGAGRAAGRVDRRGRADATTSSAVDVQRFHRSSSRTGATSTSARREGLGRLYAMHWPHLQPHTARNVRRSPAARPPRRRARVLRRARRLRAAPTGTRPPASTPCTSTATAARTGSSTSPASIARRARRWRCSTCRRSPRSRWPGPTRCGWSSRSRRRTSTSRVGRVVYTLFLNALGGIELDGTITRLAEDRFLVVTPTAAHAKTLSMLRRAASGTSASVFDATTGLGHHRRDGAAQPRADVAASAPTTSSARRCRGVVPAEIEVGRRVRAAACGSASSASSASSCTRRPTRR